MECANFAHWSFFYPIASIYAVCFKVLVCLKLLILTQKRLYSTMCSRIKWCKSHAWGKYVFIMLGCSVYFVVVDYVRTLINGYLVSEKSRQMNNLIYSDPNIIKTILFQPLVIEKRFF